MTTQASTPIVRYFDDVNVGDEIPKLVKSPMTHLQLVRYAGASGDFNPLHTDPKVGESMGMTHLDDVITCTGIITEKTEVDGEGRISGKIQAADQNGDVKVSGTFTAVLPRK